MFSGAVNEESQEPGKGFEILIADDSEREELYAELWFDNEMWAEITQEHNQVRLNLYPRQNGEPWSLPFEAAQQQIRRAYVALRGDRAAGDVLPEAQKEAS